MTEPKVESESGETKFKQGTLCAKCDHMNPGGSNVCHVCGAHLYVSCHHCGHRNQRVMSHCAHCGERLHRSLLRRWHRKLFPKHSSLKLWHVLLLIVTVAIAYRIILKLANL
jgi:predicted amidophosphoribosyltransferase